MKGMHGIVFSYERRNDLRELTERRAPASIPFGGRYRAVDFALSNMVNAGITDVGVVLHGRFQSLMDHLGTGKDWDLSRKRGGLKLLPCYVDTERRGDGELRGKIDALIGIRSYLDTIRQDYVVMMDGDLVTNLPLTEVYEEHIRSGADITCVCGDDCFAVADGTYFEMDETGKITDTLYHINQPRGRRSLEVHVLSRDLLISLVDECATHDHYSFRRDVLQRKRDSLNIRAFVWKEYAAQIRSVKEYYDRSMQLLQQSIRQELFCPDRPIRAKSSDEASSYIHPESHCRNSIVGDGCRIEGVVEDSILFPGVTVEKGAEVRGCVLFKGTHIGENAKLHHVIADKYVDICAERTLMGHETYPMVVAKGSKI